MIEQKPVAKTAQTYQLRTALLSNGRTHRILAKTKSDGHGMNVAIKCYAEGGENEFHTHAGEDHTFVVLQGSAVFHQPDAPDQLLERNGGILIPAGAFYKFEAVPGEPLVLLRVGNSSADGDDRLGLNGGPLPSNSVENKHVDGTPIQGAFYE
jgi:mannose-6-phosphate isomerase-like protein (cupin superfamily)